MNGEMTVKSLRLPKGTIDKIAAYRMSSGETEAEALRSLIDMGLAAQSLDMYSAPLARLIRDILQGQLDLFRDELEERNDELEERVARICAKGTKCSIQSALISTDTMRGLFPALAEMGPEEIWRSYYRRAGEMQGGASFAEAMPSRDD